MIQSIREVFSALLNKVYEINRAAAQICIVNFTIALISMLLYFFSLIQHTAAHMSVLFDRTLHTFLSLIVFIHDFIQCLPRCATPSNFIYCHIYAF